VVPDVAGIDKTFDYLAPAGTPVGALVRVTLNGRRIGAWVVALDVAPPEGVALRPINKVTGLGPSADVIALADWAAWRWAGRPSVLLKTASPPMAVRGLPPGAPRRPPMHAAVDLPPGPRTVVRLAPAADPYPWVEAAAARGAALVLAPSVAVAGLLGARLRRAGVPVAVVPRDWARAAAGGSVVVGARAAAWAPVPDLAAVVVLDAHDEAYQEERVPTWDAWVVGAERARRAGVPCVLVSPTPLLEQLAWAGDGGLVAPSRPEERAGWAMLDVVDRRQEDPRSGLFSARLVDALRGGGRVVCVLNRKGRARLLACASCGELGRCERCGSALEQVAGGADRLHCRACGLDRPVVCAACGSVRFKNLRAGVSRVREELAALAGEPVDEITAESESVDGGPPMSRVVVGTEAALHRVDAADVVAFLDMDQELLAPRFRAAEQALGLLARASRLVGGRAGRVLVQTRVPHHEVLDAALHADPGRLAAVEQERRAALSLPPFTALAALSGEGSGDFAAKLLGAAGIEVIGPDDGRWLVRAPSHAVLGDALAATPRPAGRLRIEVDPRRV
jgi:primosomal protein N' (replication factor Y)